jgi:hypothetical protein
MPNSAIVHKTLAPGKRKGLTTENLPGNNSWAFFLSRQQKTGMMKMDFGSQP